jgi:hypothetical protein
MTEIERRRRLLAATKKTQQKDLAALVKKRDAGLSRLAHLEFLEKNVIRIVEQNCFDEHESVLSKICDEATDQELKDTLKEKLGGEDIFNRIRVQGKISYNFNFYS